MSKAFFFKKKHALTCSTADLWKSKLTGLGPGEDIELVGESTNLVHWNKCITQISAKYCKIADSDKFRT